ncbi:helix-turn-helix transcriptional regulator [Streptomyces sp. 8N706]|uniref:helix-turn-helix transcriptional regulator n=1 Tax=Streptomyces sp. 8N706 TaxID=3457416 RepID=UPI003FD56C64
MKRTLTTTQLTALLATVDRLAGAGFSGEAESPDLLHGGWYTTEEVAELLGVDASTLRRWRTSSPPQGPPFVRLTSRVTMYSVADVEAWLTACRVVPGQVA